ncbi:MAG: hypothetical protein GX818_05800 [Tissierellia bacterium]|nr:hypothetical protein [Tissierellia bacterium]
MIPYFHFVSKRIIVSVDINFIREVQLIGEKACKTVKALIYGQMVMIRV